MEEVILPLIKEYRLNKIIQCIKCIDASLYNRNNQRDCILSLYTNKKEQSSEHREKSIFRGMVLPSLRYLGLIVGFGDSIRASANGKLIIESESIDRELHLRVLRVVINEIDKNVFHFIKFFSENSSVCKEEFINQMSIKGVVPAMRLKERVTKWLAVLDQAELILFSNKLISLNIKHISQVNTDSDISYKSMHKFQDCFFSIYHELSNDSAGVVDIIELRESVSVKMLREYKWTLTEDQFDEMLRKMSFETSQYLISLGKPMGEEEKLFEYKGNYFRTLFVKSQKKGGI